MERVFILGAGFSKALCDYMPTTAQLLESIKTRQNVNIPVWFKRIPKTPKSQNGRIHQDLEELLTLLAEGGPWNTRSEINQYDSTYQALIKEISTIIIELERSNRYNLKSFGRDFIRYLNDNWQENSVITFNFDTLLESILQTTGDRALEQIGYNLYKIPIAYLASKSGGMVPGGIYEDCFPLLKLHGSINWFYSGATDDAQVYFHFPLPTRGGTRPKNELSEEAITLINKEQRMHEILRGNSRELIIPPLLNKRNHYAHSIIKHLWHQAREVLSNATEVFFVGYSLPKSDIQARMFFRETLLQNRNLDNIFIVNRFSKEKENYRGVIKNKLLDANHHFWGENAVRDMVEWLTKE